MNIKKLVCLFSIISAMFFASPALAREGVTDWYIKDFKTEIVVNKDSSLDITEAITADCGEAIGKHGIFRVLPKKYQTTDKTYIYPTEIISVTDENNNNLIFERLEDKETITLKIGNPSVEVQGVNYYIIKYHIKNAIRWENEQFDELYWNLLGNFWELEIDNFSAKIVFPEEINRNNTEVYLYSGYLDDSENSLGSNYQWTADSALEVKNNTTIGLYQGITVSVTFPKSVITPYVLTSKEQGKWQTNDYILAFIFIVLIPLLSFYICYKLWRKHGDDPKMVKTIIPEFEIPENLTPMEMGVIMKSGGFGNNAITASIVSLAVKGYLIMQEEKEKILFVKYNEYKFIRTEKEIDDKLYKGEAKLLEKLFEGRVKEVSFSSLKNRFYKEIPKITKITVDDLGDRKLIVNKSKIYQTTMIAVGIFIIFPGLWFIAFFWPIALSFFLCGLPVIIFGIFMPKRTENGSELNWRISGFKYYMDTAEKSCAQFY
jgi:hypothetical protein